MPFKDALGDRMKGYENESRIYLDRKTPVIIRVDGKAFHTFTRGFEKPFDDILAKTMQETMKFLCENIQGAVIGYTQSDEITIVVIDYQQENSDAWFGYNLQKMASVAASLATLEFNRKFKENFDTWKFNMGFPGTREWDEYTHRRYWTYLGSIDKGAMFDARAFSLPRFEVINCLIWRQLDAVRNSVQAIAQSMFSHRELMGLDTKQLKEKIYNETGVRWEEYSDYNRHGICCIKTDKELVNSEGQKYTRKKWIYEDIDFLKEKFFVNCLIKENVYDEGNETEHDADATE